MSRRIAVLACTICLLIGTADILSPTAASASGGWTTLARQCWTIQNDGDRVRACTSIKAGLVEEQLMIRTRCRIKALNFEPSFLWIESCKLENIPDLDLLASTRGNARYGVTGLILKSPMVRCDPSIAYEGFMDFSFPFPGDAWPGSYGLGVEWPEWPNKADCSLPT